MAVDKSLNMVVVMGNVGKDPDIRNLQNGNQVGNVSVATDEGYFDKNQQWQDATEWHRVTVFGRAVQKLSKVRKGDVLMVEGKIKTDSWDDAQTGQKRYSTYIMAQRIKIVDDHGRAKAERENGGYNQQPAQQQQPYQQQYQQQQQQQQQQFQSQPRDMSSMPPAPEDKLPF